MLRFLKALFGKTSAQPAAEGKHSVRLAEFESWISGISAPAKEKLSSQIFSSKEKISQISSQIREKTSALQAAQLMNPNIPDRVKDFMTGNREEYSRRVLQYLDKIAIPDDSSALSPFLEQHPKDAEEFTKGILRPFQILQEFFSNETKEITSMVADIEREIESLRTAAASVNPEAYSVLVSDSELLAARQRQLSGLQSEKAMLEKQKLDAENSIKAINTEEERLLKESERESLRLAIFDSKSKLKAHEQKIIDVFKNFEPALRKFQKMATRNIKLLEHYLKDPAAALVSDMHLEILEAVTDIQRLLKFDRLPLGDKKEYVIDAMGLLTREYLGTWLSEYGKLSKAEKDAQRAFEECTASKTLIRIQKLRDDTKRNMAIIDQKITQLNKDISRINLAEMKQKLEEKAKSTTGKEVEVIL
jgi:hypothetical protein